MSIKRPGEFAITDRGIELAGLKKGDKILDVGCGDGDSLAYMSEKYGLIAEGIDMSLKAIEEAKKNHENINVKLGDGEFLDEYSSYTFDAVSMECVLSLINMPDEALHEAYCVLKKGGKLIINDLYYKKPDPKMIKAVEIEAKRQSKLAHKEGSCEEQGEKFVDFRLKGAFLEEPLRRQLAEIGYEIIALEDRSEDLDSYVVQHVMNGGDVEDFVCVDLKQRKNIGYFLMVAKKPE